MSTTGRKVEYLTEGETMLAGLCAGEVGVWRWRIGEDDVRWTENLETLHALQAGSFDGTLSSFRDHIHPDDIESVLHSIDKAVESEGSYQILYRHAASSNGEPSWIEAKGGVVCDAEGVQYLTGVCQDVTLRTRDERELERRLRQQQGIASLGSFAIAEPDLQRILDHAVRTAAGIFDVPLAKILQLADDGDHLVLRAGVGWDAGLVGTATVGADQRSQAGFTLISGDPVTVEDLQAETRFTGPPLLHEHGVRSGVSAIIRGADARPFGVFGVHSRDMRHFNEHDVDCLVAVANIVTSTLRHRAANESSRRLLSEMAHRTGNILQLVSSIASQTFVPGRDMDYALASFGDRLASLSRASHLVAEGGWESTRLISLLEESLSEVRDSVAFSGRDILLPGDLCFDLSLLLHELTANSMKYGSMARGAAKISIAWALDRTSSGGQIFRFVWNDPEAMQGATDFPHGFGAKLKKALIEGKWHGTISIEREQGYRFSLEIPLPERSSAPVGLPVEPSG